MEYYNQRMQDTVAAINQFKKEQEQILLGSASGINLASSKYASSGSAQPSFAPVASPESVLGKILNVNCVIMPFCTTSNAHQKLWPQALISNRTKSCGEVGHIESHGSLWKIIPLDETDMMGSKVLLQCSEHGEPARYLSADLEMVEMKVDGAVWRLRLSTSSSKSEATGAVQGIVVVLELLGRDGRSAGTGKEAQVLVCETSRELRDYSELFVEPVLLRGLPGAAGDGGPVSVGPAEGAGQDGEAAHPTFRSCEWEVVPEAWLGQGGDAGLDFLQGYIN